MFDYYKQNVGKSLHLCEEQQMLLEDDEQAIL